MTTLVVGLVAFSAILIIPTQLANAAISSVASVQSNNIVNTRTAYDILFRTASAGAIKTVEMTFPSGTTLSNRVLEVSGVGPGTSTISGQTLIYTITSPISVPGNTLLRFEVWNVNNPTQALASYAVKVSTKDSVGGTIDSGTSAAYSIKQIGTGDIANNAITSAKIQDGQVGTSDLADNSVSTTQFSSKLADGAVTTPKIAQDAVTTSRIKDLQVTESKIGNGAVTANKLATDSVAADEIVGVSKLIYAQCKLDYTTIPVGTVQGQTCTIPGASQSAGDVAVVTNNGIDGGSFYLRTMVPGAQITSENQVTIYLRNEDNIDFDPLPQLFAVTVFHQ